MASGVLGYEASKRSQPAAFAHQVSIAKLQLPVNQLGCAVRATTVLLVAHLPLLRRLLVHQVASARPALRQRLFAQLALISHSPRKESAFLALQVISVNSR